MLGDAETENFEDIIRWEPNGESFKVHKKKAFEESIQPLYLNQTKLRSFQRKLISHGFNRVQGGPARGAYHHSKFVKGRRDLISEIERGHSQHNISSFAGSACSELGSSDDDVSCTSSNIMTSTMTDSGVEATLRSPTMSSHFMKAVVESRPSLRRGGGVQQDERCFASTTAAAATASTAATQQTISYRTLEGAPVELNRVSLKQQGQYEDRMILPSPSFPGCSSSSAASAPSTRCRSEYQFSSLRPSTNPWQPLALSSYAEADPPKGDDTQVDIRMNNFPYLLEQELQASGAATMQPRQYMPPFLSRALNTKEALPGFMFELDFDNFDMERLPSGEQGNHQEPRLGGEFSADERTADLSVNDEDDQNPDTTCAAAPSSAPLETFIEEFINSSLSPSSDPFSPRPMFDENVQGTLLVKCENEKFCPHSPGSCR